MLPYCFLVFIWMSQLMLATYAAIEPELMIDEGISLNRAETVSPLWYPNEIKGNFLEDMKTYQVQDKKQPSSFSCLTRPPVPPDSEKAAMSYFKSQFKTLQKISMDSGRQEQQLNLVNQAVNHILSHESISRADLKEWCQVLTKTMKDHPTFLEIHVEIFFALYNLRLQRYKDVELTKEIKKTMKVTVPKLSHPSPSILWSYELFPPHEVLSIDLRNFGKQHMLYVEPSLKQFTTHIYEEYRLETAHHLRPVLRNIFSNPPPKDISAQTRIVAITLLFHLLRLGRDGYLPYGLAGELLREREKYFLFEHERQLLEWVLGDHDNREGKLKNVKI
ncbi:hypothetical protein PtA15_5A686 [Puccinia triticina]|uniref:Uncharacterized protein n=1 Tax=Puccinia triticina TaxID=208348 RepID=A0ABY7CMB3_9BASI|nr:uncharacterized protein PtA15_5A686 [Puccinia triticina]WAQ85112.1 hypothetical protein PtA15_5A686 [Puccinia triticina]